MESRISRKKMGFIDFSIITWLLFSLTYLVCKNTESSEIISAYLSLLGQSGLDLILSIVMYCLWRDASESEKAFYAFMLLSFVAAFFADGFYNYLLNIKKQTITGNIDIIFDLPFTFFLLFQVVAWAHLAVKIGKSRGYSRAQLSTTMIGPLAFFIFFTFSIDWTVGHFSIIGGFHFAHNVLEAIGLFFVTLVLLKLKTTSLRMMAYGYIIIAVSDISIRYSVILQNYQPLNTFETLWILGLSVFVLAGLTEYFGIAIHSSYTFRLADRLLRCVGIEVEESFFQSCICSKNIDNMVTYLVNNTKYTLSDIANILDLKSGTYDQLKMSIATNEVSFEKLWSMYQLTINER